MVVTESQEPLLLGQGVYGRLGALPDKKLDSATETITALYLGDQGNARWPNG